MNSSVTRSFRQRFAELPAPVQARARKQFKLWQQNHWHPSLHFKKVGPYWSVRISAGYRAVGLERSGRVYWFYIGPRGQYEEQIE